MSDRLAFSETEFADALGLSVDALRKGCQAGEIPPPRMFGRLRRFLLMDLEADARARATGVQTAPDTRPVWQEPAR